MDLQQPDLGCDIGDIPVLQRIESPSRDNRIAPPPEKNGAVSAEMPNLRPGQIQSRPGNERPTETRSGVPQSQLRRKRQTGDRSEYRRLGLETRDRDELAVPITPLPKRPCGISDTDPDGVISEQAYEDVRH